MHVSRRYVISGRVQGVGFRYFTQDAAVHEDVCGWVRNMADGRVEVEAEGETEAVQRFEIRVRCGPPGARVDGVETTDRGVGVVSDPTPAPRRRNTGFAIR